MVLSSDDVGRIRTSKCGASLLLGNNTKFSELWPILPDCYANHAHLGNCQMMIYIK